MMPLSQMVNSQMLLLITMKFKVCGAMRPFMDGPESADQKLPIREKIKKKDFCS